MRYGIICDLCGREDEISMHHSEYRSDKLPFCTCGQQMRRDWRDSARLDYRSKGRFGFVTKNLDGTPQYVHDYQDLQRKMKANGLHLFEPTSDDLYEANHMKDKR